MLAAAFRYLAVAFEGLVRPLAIALLYSDVLASQTKIPDLGTMYGYDRAGSKS